MVYDYPTLCHHTQGFLCHQICQFLLHRKDESEFHIFSPGENLTRITLSGTFRLIAEKDTLSFLWCPRMMFSAPQYPVFPAGCSQRNASNWTPGVKASLCKKDEVCLPENSSSRHSKKS
ncbi:hypothetical protein TNCV_2956811 [Trichonephila clavipes]|nr:hypothetical protein TNCV_2956811 [Trichonephila clavipes]